MNAAVRDLSVAAPVERDLTEPDAGKTESQRLKQQERWLRARIPADYPAADTLVRNESTSAMSDCTAYLDSNSLLDATCPSSGEAAKRARSGANNANA
jgi:hypothetical protein